MYFDLYENYLIREYGFKRLLPKTLWFLLSIVLLFVYVISWEIVSSLGKIGTIACVTSSTTLFLTEFRRTFRKFQDYYACQEDENGNLILNPRTTKKGHLRAGMMICYLPDPDAPDTLVLENIKVKGSVLIADKCTLLRPNRKPIVTEDYVQQLAKKPKKQKKQKPLNPQSNFC